MNAKQKEILQVQRSLLSKNIVWTPVLAANLKANNLLTDAMIAQIDVSCYRLVLLFLCLWWWPWWWWRYG